MVDGSWRVCLPRRGVFIVFWSLFLCELCESPCYSSMVFKIEEDQAGDAAQICGRSSVSIRGYMYTTFWYGWHYLF